jgi:carbon monoxide dehydrogenase subunit G
VGDIVAQSIEIEAPIDAVWDLVMDPERLGEWVSIHRSVSEVPAGDLTSGSRFRQQMKLKGVPLRVRWEVVECERPKHARWQGKAGGGAVARISYELSEHEGKTRFEYENEFELPAGKVGQLAGRAFNAISGEREARRSLARLKQLLENVPSDS